MGEMLRQRRARAALAEAQAIAGVGLAGEGPGVCPERGMDLAKVVLDDPAEAAADPGPGAAGLRRTREAHAAEGREKIGGVLVGTAGEDVVQALGEEFRIDMGEATPIQISRNAIVVDGETVLELRNGLVDPSQKQGGGTGFLITPLFREMGRIRDLQKLIEQRTPSRPFKGEVQIVADQRTPFRTMSEVIYTLGQTEFSNIRFVTNKTGELGGGPR